jgi:hypothetical protein
MFLEQSELKTVAVDEVVNRIINNDATIVEAIIAESIDLMKSYLFQYFDTAAVFGATGTARNLTILRHLKGIVIFEIYSRRTKTINELAKLRYDEAMLWLEKVSAGKIKPDLPPKLVDTDGDGVADGEVPFMKLGSRKTYPNGW